jgi:GxxExxY protein
MNECELILKDEVYAIVGAAIEVSNELGTGFLEAVYQEALAIELCSRRIPFTAQPTINIAYKGVALAKSYVPISSATIALLSRSKPSKS